MLVQRTEQHIIDRQNKLNKSIDDMSLAITQILIDNNIIM